ncbi:hypothetical protein [Rhizobium sp. SG2393]|uniref:hypothetical protein n=1 Tax=Rhizobium sp. SG2393 TaxID=3276279 RepID=UPI00366E1EFB
MGTRIDPSSIEETLAMAAARLAGKGLLTHGDVLSQRIPEQNKLVAVTINRNQDVPDSVVWQDLSGKPQGLHHRIYAARPDVGAIAGGQMTWTRALARLDVSLPAVFDEQVRHLGVEARRVAFRSGENWPLATLANGANAYCFDDLALCFGMGLERLLLNIEILEKCAESFVLAYSAAGTAKRIPWLIRYIANGRLKKDQKDAATRHLSGERSIMKAGY